MTLGRLASEWGTFAEHILPADAPAIQKQETKRAFYAGAAAALHSLAAILGPDEEPTDDEIQALEDMHQEVKRFFADVERGKA